MHSNLKRLEHDCGLIGDLVLVNHLELPQFRVHLFLYVKVQLFGCLSTMLFVYLLASSQDIHREESLIS